MQRIIAEINHHLASCVADLSFEMDKKQWWDRCSALWHLSRWKLSCCRKIISVPEIFDDFRELFPYNFPHFYCCYCFQSPQYRDRINSFKTKLLWLSGQRKEQFSSLKDMVYKSKSLDSFDAKAAETFNAPSWKSEKKMWSKSWFCEFHPWNFISPVHIETILSSFWYFVLEIVIVCIILDSTESWIRWDQAIDDLHSDNLA